MAPKQVLSAMINAPRRGSWEIPFAGYPHLMRLLDDVMLMRPAVLLHPLCREFARVSRSRQEQGAARMWHRAFRAYPLSSRCIEAALRPPLQPSRARLTATRPPARARRGPPCGPPLLARPSRPLGCWLLYVLLRFIEAVTDAHVHVCTFTTSGEVFTRQLTCMSRRRKPRGRVD